MTQTVIIVVVIAVLAIIFGWLALYGEYVIDKKIKRNREVYIFRLWVIENRMDLYDRLPSYDEMLEDGKALALESYFPELFN